MAPEGQALAAPALHFPFNSNAALVGSSGKEEDQQWSSRSSPSSSRQCWATAAAEFDNVILVDVNQRNRATGALPCFSAVQGHGRAQRGIPF
nr:hypothetical protein Itr_chr15CG12060 [Ipomoea trifida]